MVKKSLAILLTAIFVSVWLISCSPGTSTLSSNPHLNPETQNQVYSDVDLMRNMLRLLDSVIAENPQELEKLKVNLRFAAIRPEAEERMALLLSSALSLSRSIVMSRADLESIMLLAKQNRLDEAKYLALDLAQRLLPAVTDLNEMDTSVKTLERVTNVDKSPVNSEIRILYTRAIQSLTNIGQPIRAIDQFGNDGDIEALLKKLQIQIDLEKYSALQTTELSLEISSERAYVGDSIFLRGKLTSRGVALPGRDVVLEIDGKNQVTVKTDSNGYYSAELRLPYVYNNVVAVKARYVPVGVDSEAYLAAVNPPVKVETPYYETRLRIGGPLKGYPGLSTAIEGDFSYVDPPFPGARKVNVLIDGSLASSAMVGEYFSIETALDRKMSSGEHQILVVAPGQGRYGPVSEEVTLNVVKATPVVNLKTTRLAFIPWGLEIQGKAESEIAPLNSAQIRLRFGEKVTEVTTTVDGTFQYRFGLSFLSALIGQKGLEIEVIPLEPWNSSVATRKNIWVFNPIGLAILLLIVAIVYYGIKLRMKSRNTGPSVVTGPRIPVTDSISGSGSAAASQEPSFELIDRLSGEDKVLQIYKNIVRFIAGILEIKIKPNLTLRELAEGVSPRLGKASSYLWQMTLIAEKVIYSKHSLVEKDRQDVDNLASQIRQGIKHGPL